MLVIQEMPHRFSQSLRKRAYSNTLKMLPPKNEKQNQKKNSDIFHISTQNIDCGYSLELPQQNIDCGYSLELPRRSSSNKYPQSMFSSRHKKNNVYPCKPRFYYTKGGFKRVRII